MTVTVLDPRRTWRYEQGPPMTTMDAPVGPALNVFTAAELLNEMENSRAKAVATDLVEWQCRTWGSGNGCSEWIETAVFDVVIARFDLRSWSDDENRDELTAAIPLAMFDDVAKVLARLQETEPESWPWFDEDLEQDWTGRVSLAAAVLGCGANALAANATLLNALRIAPH